MKTSIKTIILAATLFALLATTCPAATDTSNAFAMIGGEKSTGDFHLYPPFYDNVIAPHAFVENDTVFTAFQDTSGRPIVMAYDIKAAKWSEPATASEFGLGKDAHGNPSICIDSRGHIHIFYGCHGNRMRHTKSTRPYDITQWTEQSYPTPKATYPQTIRMADASICLFYRAGGHMEPWTLRVSDDNGDTWSDGRKVIEMRLDPPDKLAAAYAGITAGPDGKTVHCFWVHKDDNAAKVKNDKKHPWRPLKYKGLHEAVYRYNQYYIRRDAAGTWRNIEGDKVTLPVTKACADEHCLVFDSGDEFSNIARPMTDSKNRPYARFRYGVGDWKAGGNVAVPWTWRCAAWSDGKWKLTESIPTDWPGEVQSLAKANGPPAFGDKSHGNFCIWYERNSEGPQQGSYIFLRHAKDGYITRPKGPARLP